jgi:hypothetical protein
MADIDAIGRSAGLLPCKDFAERQEGPTPFESTAAELFIRGLFVSNFLTVRYPGNSMVTWQLDFVFRDYESERYSPVIATILKYMRSDFMNPLSRNRIADFVRAFRKNELTDQMLADMIKFVGWFRKPDMCGITAMVDPARIELVEVGTVKGRAGTRDELREKIQQLQQQVIPFAMQELNALALEKGVSVVRSIQALASPWRPERRVCPLPSTSDKYQWICYEPTFADAAGTGENGLVIYHIHEVDRQAKNIPLPVVIATRDALAVQRRRQTSLDLLPELAPAWAKEASLLTEDGRRILSYGAVGIAGVLAVLLAIELLPAVFLVSAAGASALGPFAAAVGEVIVLSTESQVAATTIAGFAMAHAPGR